jgi:hypothetical protein
MDKYSLRVILILAVLLVPSSLRLDAGPAATEATQDRNTSRSQGILEATKFHGSLIGMQYETWFTRGNVTWDTAEAVPIFGKYSSYDVGIIRKHAEWFAGLGIDWLLVDWSNMLWMKPDWEQHTGATHELEETTELLLKTYSQMSKEGKSTPKIVLLLGLENGPTVPDGMKRLNGIFAWLTKNYLSKAEYKDLWLYYEGKPLVTVLFNTADPCKELKSREKTMPLDAPQWTVRWMASQLQINHAESCGMWSWMDGSIRQLVTYHDRSPEDAVVTPSCFAGGGWLATSATGRDHGAPYIQSWKVAFETRPKFIQIHQWNEFAGQKEGEGYGPDHHGYVDEYNLESSDDIEPTQLQACAYRGCGGWGYYYMNLTKALISLYRGETPEITVLALSGPFQAEVVKQNLLALTWQTVGVSPGSYDLRLDGATVAKAIQGNKYALDLSRLHPGKHRVTLLANGVHTFFDLNPEKLAVKSASPLPVTSTINFMYSPNSK